MHDLIQSMPKLEVIADDSYRDVHKEAFHNHDNNLLALLELCKNSRPQLNTDRIRLRHAEVFFMRHMFTHTGL